VSLAGAPVTEQRRGAVDGGERDYDDVVHAGTYRLASQNSSQAER
jgi:hypothetical protein